jgi:oligo-1,6-glucosidase
MKNTYKYLFLFMALLLTFYTQAKLHANEQILSGLKTSWWKEAIVYQIYPRSFKDTDGDGVGDLQGIIEKLDYIKSLGVDIVWLNPIYKSPNDDNGYDISDYRGIMDEFGTMDDFDKMLNGMHSRGIRLIMDLVVNHSSDEHEWFKQSRSSRDNPYRDYYYWWPAKDGKPPYRFSFFDVNSNAWEYDKKTDAYYLHYFSVKQPDLNWENPKVRKEIYALMKFWLDKGVDGFRMDVAPLISKDLPFREIPEDEIREKYGSWVVYYTKGPRLHEFLREMNREVLSKYDVMTVGEGGDIESAHELVDEDRKELNMIFQFDGISLGKKDNNFPDPEGWNLTEFKEVYTRWDNTFKEKGWASIYLGNHDQSRMVSRWGNDNPKYWAVSAKLLHTFLLSMRATPYIYYGDEIGMTNIRFEKIEDYNDLATKNYYAQLKGKGLDKEAELFLEGQKEISRDNGRTPMQWNTNEYSGFTDSKPWLKVNPNFKSINVENQEQDDTSILNYFRKMVKTRKLNPVLIYGKYELLVPKHECLYAYTRTLGDTNALVLLNFSMEKINFNIPANFKNANVLINNMDSLLREGMEVSLLPYQAVIFKYSNSDQ